MRNIEDEQLSDYQRRWIDDVFMPWLNKAGSPIERSYRIAPSILCRSEVELLGASFPRFALRADFGSLGFANFRRLPKLAQAIGEYSDIDSLPEEVRELLIFSPQSRPHNLKNDLQQSIAFSPSVADSLLVPPPQLAQDFDIIGVSLWDAYGEQQRLQKGTPFVQHIRFGGGLCAQAASFMACCILDRWAKEIGGIPSVTHAVRKRITGRDDLVVFDGLGIEDFSEFFTSVGLSAPREVNGLCPFTERLWISDANVTSVILRSYISSGMPVIFTTTVSKMKDIYHTICSDSRPAIGEYGRGLIKQHADDSREAAHAVLLVGIENSSEADDYGRVVLQDPRALPFMVASIEELCSAQLDSHVFLSLPVTPEAVKLRLGATGIGKTISIPGLLDVLICSNLSDAACDDHLKQVRKLVQEKRSFGEWRLLGRSKSEDIESLMRLSSRYDFDQQTANQLLDLALESSDWCWLHLHRDDNGQVWFTIWDATKAPAVSLFQLGSPSPYICSFGTMVHGRVSSTCCRRRERRSPIPPYHLSKQLPSAPQLDLSLISSYSPDTSRIMFGSWPKNIQLCELYAFMNCEGFIRKRDNTDAAYVMSELARDDAFIEKTAKKLHRIAVSRERRPGNNSQVQIRALATYFPFLALERASTNLASQPTDTRARVGTSALTFALKLAAALQQLQETQDKIFPVEVVSGTRVRGLYPFQLCRPSGEALEPLFVHISKSERAIENLVTNLERAYNDARLPPKSNVSIAVELEPHSLGTITNLQEIKQFVEQLDKRKSPASQRIGLNVDIAHWRIAGIDPKEASQSPILRRIAHAHVSGHHPTGHFGDIPLMAINSPEDYYEWLHLLEKVRAEQEIPLFSGMISVECEVVAPRLIDTCIENALWLIGNWQNVKNRS